MEGASKNETDEFMKEEILFDIAFELSHGACIFTDHEGRKLNIDQHSHFNLKYLHVQSNL